MSDIMEIFKNGCLVLARIILSAALLLGLIVSTAGSTQAQTNNQPWSFTPQNRASIAALMRQIEDRENAQPSATAVAGYDQLVCGKDGDSSATGNNTCIIMNNSDGVIQIGQDANGNQTATSTTDQKEVITMSDTLESIGSDNPE